MRSDSALIAVGILTAAHIALAQKPGPDVLAAADGDLTILPITHASVSIRYASDVILIDPARFVPGQSPAPKPTDEKLHSSSTHSLSSRPMGSRRPQRWSQPSSCGRVSWIVSARCRRPHSSL